MYGLEKLYRFLGPLGRGAEGDVYLVEDLYRGNSLLALKILSEESGTIPEEFRRLARLRHPALARVHDTGQLAAGVYGPGPARYFTTEYFPGAPLTRLPAPFSWPLFEELFVQALSALAYLNREELRHGDLKPAHLLYQEHPRPTLQIIDLGHAAALGDPRAPLAGTAPYAAPELWGRASAPGRNTDLYALGMICLELWTGTLPLIGADAKKWREWHLHGDRDAAFQALKIAPPQPILEMVRSCVEPDPALRPRDAEAVLGRLRRSIAAPRSGSFQVPFVGREKILRELRQWVVSSSATRREVVLLSSAPGLGKSRLLEALKRSAQVLGVPVASLHGQIAAGEEALMEARIRHTLGGAARTRLLLLDDLGTDFRVGGKALPEWWCQLRARLGEGRLRGVLVIPLEGERSPEACVRSLREAGIPATVRLLGPLSREATAELLEEVCPDCPPRAAEVDQVFAATGGNPREILRWAESPVTSVRQPQVRHPDLEALLTQLPIPVPLEVLLKTLQWSRSQFWMEIARTGPRAPVVEGVHPLLRVHPITPETELAPQARHSQLLLEAAAAWGDSHDPDADWAPLLLRTLAGKPPPERELRTLREKLQKGGRWRELLRVAELDSTTGARWDRVRAWSHTGRVPEAVEYLKEWQPPLSSTLGEDAAAAAQLWVRAGEPERALEYFHQAMATVEDSQRRLALSIEGARTALALGDREGASRLISSLEESGALEGAAISQIAPQPAQQLATLLQQLGRYRLAGVLFRYALQEARGRGAEAVPVVIAALSGLAGEARAEGDLDAAERHLKLGIRYAARAGQAREARYLEANLAAVQYRGKRPDAALETYRRLERAAEREGNSRLLPHIGQGVGAIYRERGELLRALITLRRAARQASRTRNDRVLAGIFANIGELYLLLGDPREAYRYRLQLLRIARRIGDHSLTRQGRAAVGAALVRLGQYREAKRLLELAARMEAGEGGRWLDAMIFVFLGEVEWCTENPRAALQAWAYACRQGIRCRRPYYVARAIAGMARTLEEDHPGRAHALYQRAQAWSEQDSCPALSRIPLTLQRLRFEIRDKGRAPAKAAELAALFQSAGSYGLREEAIGALLWLQSFPPSHSSSLGSSSLGKGRQLQRSLTRRLQRRERAALARRLEIPLRELVHETSPETKPLPIDLRHSPGDRDLEGALQELMRFSRGSSAELWVQWNGKTLRLARTGSSSRGEPSSPVEAEPPRSPLPQGSPVGASGPHGNEVWLPLHLGQVADAAAVRLQVSSLHESWSHPIDLAEMEFLALDALLRWREGIHTEEIDELRLELDRLREQGLEAKEQLETDILTQRLEMQRLNENMRQLIDPSAMAPPWVAVSSAMRGIEKNLRLWATSDLSIFLHGESGTGKSALVHRLHSTSGLWAKPCRVENCSALPEPLLEAEMFGYLRGAFTGADRDHDGIFARSSGGTLVLDHLDELPLRLQVKLLRVLETRMYRPLGAEEDRPFEVRLMVTSRSSPQEAIRRGALSKELYYRLQGIEIFIPPLRERPEEVVPLLEGHLAWHSRKMALSVPQLSHEALEVLKAHSWPGNVREINNLVQRWLIVRRSSITAGDVRDLVLSEEEAVSQPKPGVEWRSANKAFQRSFLRATLAKYGGNQKKTSEALGISRRHLQNLLLKLELRSPRE